MNIILVGLGNIGFRHFQSFSKNRSIKNLFVIEKDKIKINNIKNKQNNKNTFFYKKVRDIKFNSRIDLVILATNSDVRFKLFNSLVNKFTINYIIFEKVVFQSIDHLKKTRAIINKKKIKAYINCSMRSWKFFINLKKKINNKKKISLSFSGNRWGMASNYIHYIDLFMFLTESKTLKFDLNLYDKIFYSKRKGFYEIGGEIKALDKKNNSLYLKDEMKATKESFLFITNNKFIFKIKAGRKFHSINKIFIKTGKIIKKYKFRTPLQSQISFSNFKEIIKNKKCLPSYEDLFDINLLSIRLINNHFKKLKNNREIFKIT